MSKPKLSHSDQSSDEAKEQSFDLVATAHSPSGGRLGIYLETGTTSLLIPTHLTIPSKSGDLEALFVENDLDWVFAKYPRSQVGAALRKKAKKKQVVVIDRRGVNRIGVGESSTWVYIWNGRALLLKGKKKPPIKLVGDALVVEPGNGTHEGFMSIVGPIAEVNPRVLVLLFLALTPALAHVHGHPTMSGMLVGRSTQGKTTLQKLLASFTGTGVHQWDGTRNGIKELLAASPDRPVFIDEVHLADSWDDFENVVMGAGNGSKRLVHGFSSGPKAPGLQATPILSGNKHPSEMHPRQRVPDQVWARMFVVQAHGEYGMFDNLAGYPSPEKLAEALETAAAEHYGVVWPIWLNKLSKDREYVAKDFEGRVDRLVTGIHEASGGGSLNALDRRVLKRLAFVAYVGNIARHLGLVTVTGEEIRSAFGRLFREHLSTMPRDAEEQEEAIVMAVSEHLERNFGLFPQVDSAGSAEAVRGLLGYSNLDNQKGSRYLYLPGVFRDTFEKKFGKDVYRVLADRGYLITQGSRNYLYEKRVTIGGKKVKKFFYVIDAVILHQGKKN